MTNLSLEVARHAVEEYRTRLECEPCDFLIAVVYGLDAYEWLKQAESLLDEAARMSLLVGVKDREMLRDLYREWFRLRSDALIALRWACHADRKAFRAACKDASRFSL
ncbi:MAG: hypothetical protein ACYDH4_11260 [Candidatus Cryosericum sp.]